MLKLHAFFITFLLSCGSEQDRAEVIDRVRALGIDHGTLEAVYENEGTVTVYVAMPKEKKGVITAYTQPNKGKFHSIPADRIQILKEQYESHYGFDLLIFQASVKMPSLSELGSFKKARFGFLVASENDLEYLIEEINFSKNATKETIEPITVDMLLASSSFKVNVSTDIQSTYTNPNQEAIRFGWFVSDGKIINRRATKTKWTAENKGQQTLLFTARGQDSKSFAFKIIDVVVE